MIFLGLGESSISLGIDVVLNLKRDLPLGVYSQNVWVHIASRDSFWDRQDILNYYCSTL